MPSAYVVLDREFRFPFSSKKYLSFVSRHHESGEASLGKVGFSIFPFNSSFNKEIAEAIIWALEFGHYEIERNEAEKCGTSKQGKIK